MHTSDVFNDDKIVKAGDVRQWNTSYADQIFIVLKRKDNINRDNDWTCCVAYNSSIRETFWAEQTIRELSKLIARCDL